MRAEVGDRVRAQDEASGTARAVRGRGDRGTVTAEVAITLPAVVLVLVAGLAVCVAAVGQLRCADAARAAARAAAVGQDLASVRATAVALAGEGAAVVVSREGEWTVVRVQRRLSPPGWVTGPLVARAEARAWTEPTVAAASP